MPTAVREDDDTGLFGWTIYVDYNGNSSHDLGQPSAVTDASGAFTITDAAPTTITTLSLHDALPICSYPNPGSPDAQGDVASTNCSYSVTTTSGGSVTGRDF